MRSTGGDVVGMSTVPEVVVACEEGIRTLVLSLVTNEVVGRDDGRMRSVRDEVEREVSGRLYALDIALISSTVSRLLGRRSIVRQRRRYRMRRCCTWVRKKRRS